MGFGFGREEAFDVELADGVAEDGGGEDIATDVAGTLLGGSGERCAEEEEGFVGEGFGDARGVGLDEVVGEEVFPCIERLRGDESGFSGEGRRLPDDEGALLVETGGTEELGPVEAGGFCDEVGGVPRVVGFVNVFAVGEGELLFGDGGFESDDAGGADARLGEAGETEDCSDVILILGANDFDGLGVVEVVVAIG